MKYVALLLLGVLSVTEAKSSELTQLNAQNIQAFVSDSESESDDAENVQLDAPPCVYLDETQDELDYQLDMFSRTLDTRHWTNVKNLQGAIAAKTGSKPPLAVHTWELYDKAFTFPRIRRYQYVNENMDMLEHFEDNLNTNVSNGVNFDRFLRVANSVRQNLLTKYHDGEFVDPALTDPKKED